MGVPAALRPAPANPTPNIPILLLNIPMASNTALCDQCNSSGLPIMPVRYTAVPNAVQPCLPAWAGGNRVTSVALGSEFKYALRTLREGYLYIFYDKNRRGSNQWECYSVCQDGCMKLQLTPQAAQPQDLPTFQCGSSGHNNVLVRYIVIEEPHKCGATWLAFSQHKWSDETLKEYTENSALRNKRMQTIHPAALAGGAKHSHGAIAEQAVLESVLEYAPAFKERDLPFGGNVPEVSKEDGSLQDPTGLARVSTRFPWAMRQGQAESTAKSMKARGKPPHGKPNTPHVIALWDAIGIAHELNGYRNDAAGWIKKYGDERELQITAYNAIEGCKKALEKKAADGVNNLNQQGFSSPTGEMNRLRVPIAQNTPNAASAQAFSQQYYLLDQKYRNGEIGMSEFQAQRAPLVQRYASNPAGLNAALAQEDGRKTAFEKGNLTAQVKARAEAWPKYEDRLYRGAIDKFKNKWDEFLKSASALVDRRTVDLVKWLEASLFLDTLEDFHRTNPDDGVLFEDVVGDAIFGMGSSNVGQQKIDQWVKDAQSSVSGNLLWRAIASNQSQAEPDIDAALALVYGPSTPMNSGGWEHLAGQVKWNKVFDLAKKSLTAYNTQMKAVNDATSGIAKVANMRGLDKIFVTVGGSWLKPLTAAVDGANELALRTFLLVRSGVDPLAAKAVAAMDAKNTAVDREMLVRRLLNQDYYLSEAAQADYKARADKWAALRSSIEVPDAKRQSFNASRDARMALIVAVFEAWNLYKTGEKAAKQPHSERAQAALTAAKFATSAAAIDVASNWTKGLAALGDRAVSYQAMKFGGGALSAVASGYGAALDFGATQNEIGEESYEMATLLGIRGTFQATSAVLGSLTALSYCSPLIETFGKRFGERMIGRALTAAAERLLLARAALVFASLEVSVFLLAVTVIIWYFEDDALEKWCDRCAFGLKRKVVKDPYIAADSQIKGFTAALTGVE